MKFIFYLFPLFSFSQSSTVSVNDQPGWGLYVDADSSTAKAWTRASDGKDRYKNNPANIYATHNYNAANAVVGDIIPTQAAAVQSLYNLGITGSGVKIAMLDDGFSVYNGLTFAGGRGSYLNESPSETVTEHGTTMSSIINEKPNMFNGLNKPNGIVGIAYGASLYAVPYNGSGTLAAKIQWCIDSSMDIINIPLTLSTDADFTAKIQEAISKGIVICAASGNGPYSSLQPITYPARIPGVFAITSNKGGHVFGSDTGYVYGNILPVNGKGIDFSVPSWIIGHDNAYSRLATAHTGTSESVSIFTGYAALILEYHKRYMGLKLNPSQFAMYLYKNATATYWGSKQFTNFDFIISNILP